MAEKNRYSGQTADLRKQAEKIAREDAVSSPEKLEAMSPAKIRQTLHELRVHQIELTMQNEELQRAHAELEASRARYFDLYDLAPVGYLTVSEQGLILEANLTAATQLGLPRSALTKQPLTKFILKEDEDIYYMHRKKLFETGEPQTCELRMVEKDSSPFWARLEANLAQDARGVTVCRVVLSDITALKRAEFQREAALEEIRKLNEGLEQKVSERTAELRENIAHLKVFNDAFVGRELRMAELKEQIAKLEGKKDYSDEKK
jgi:PAS domain S-box-containing protein